MKADYKTDLSALSNEMVALYKLQFGRGPTKVRADWAGPDALLVTLEHSLTPAELRLVEMGELGRLRDMRTFFQYASSAEFIEITERLTGRSVRAFVSGIDTMQDVSSEVFYMHPAKAGQDGFSANHDGSGANHDGSGANHDGFSAAGDGFNGDRDGAGP